MTHLAKIVNIRSQAAERILNFYSAQEAECEDVPLVPWRDGRKLKGSEVYVEMRLLSDRNPAKKTSSAASSQISRLKSILARLPFRKKLQSLTKLGLFDELSEFRHENSIRERESWKKIFSEKGLRVIFKGGAGSGKSFSLTQEVREKLVKARAELEDFNCSLNELEIPIFIRAGALVSSSGVSLADVILNTLPNAVKSSLSHSGDWLYSAFKTEQGRRLFIVIDGLDELPEASQSHFRERMKQMDEELKSASLIVTCRTMYFEERRDWVSWAGDRRTKIVELAPLEEEQQSQLIEKLIGTSDGSQKTLLGLLKRNYSLSHFCRTPFVLTSTCLLYEDGWLSEKTNYDSLYKALTEKMLAGDWKELSQRPEWTKKSDVLRDAAKQDRIALLSQVSWHLFKASPSENRFTMQQWRAAYDKALNKEQIAEAATLLLNELVLVGMVINAGYDDNHNKCYSFAHRTILEHFAARGLVELHKESAWVKTLVTHLWCESDWVEVIRFAASYTDNPTSLLRRVGKKTDFAKPRPIQRLSGFCRSLAFLIGWSLFFFFVGLFLVLFNSHNSKSEFKEYFSGRKPYTENLSSLWDDTSKNLAAHWDELDSPRGDVMNFVYFLKSEITSYYPLLKDEFVNLYNFTFQFLQQESLYDRDTSPKAFWGFLVDNMDSVMPVLVVVALALYFGGAIIGWLDRKMFYWIGFTERDDIFQTGLRVQAEIIGHNEKVSGKEVERVVKKLQSSTAMYGASKEERIPEDLLLLVGSNINARRRLSAYWLKLVDKRRRNLEWCNRLYEKILSRYVRALYFIRRNEVSPLFTAGDFKKVWCLADKLTDDYGNDYYRDIDNTTLLSAYICDKLSPGTKHLLEEYYSKESQEQLKIAFAADFNSILKDPSLYEYVRFKKIELKDETSFLLREKPTGEKLKQLNRLLLEAAYPKEIRKMKPFWLRIAIRIYDEILSWYQRLFSVNIQKEASPLFTANDFKRARKLARKFIDYHHDDYQTRKLSKYVREKLSPDTEKLIKNCSQKICRPVVYVKAIYNRPRLKGKFSKQRREKIANALAKDFNVILREQSLYEDERFLEFRLRTETRNVLEQNPSGEDLVYLNRLLLEDAYSKMPKMQKKWLRLIIWSGRKLLKETLLSFMSKWRNVPTDSNLFRAFRGLSLLPDEQIQPTLTKLLEQNALSAKYLVDEKRTKRTFTQLDIFAAKALAKSGDESGKKRLAEIAGQIDEKNNYTPSAIEELSSVDEKRAIELAATCLESDWKADNGYSYTAHTSFQNVFSSLPYETVINELSRLSEENADKRYFNSVLLPFLRKISSETTRDWLQKTAGNGAQKFLAKSARRVLENESNKYWIDGDGWAEDLISKIKESLDKADFDAALKKFDTLISPSGYYHDYPSSYSHSPEGFINNSERIAEFCNKELLERWFDKHGGGVSAYGNLALLAGEPGGQPIKKFLIKRATDPKYEYFDSEWRKNILLVLGEMGDDDAEETLLRILKKTRRLEYRFKSRFGAINFDREEYKNHILGGLAKLGSDEALQQIRRELNKKTSWINYYLAARLLAERDDPLAIKLLLKGKKKRGSSASWKEEFGDEPELREMALQFGARITKVSDGGFVEYVAISQSRNFKYRV